MTEALQEGRGELEHVLGALGSRLHWKPHSSRVLLL